MSSIAIELNEEQLVRLQSIAEKIGVSVETLARLSLEELLARPDDEFERAADYALKK
jgi:predicted transcriptional regulator